MKLYGEYITPELNNSLLLKKTLISGPDKSLINKESFDIVIGISEILCIKLILFDS